MSISNTEKLLPNDEETSTPYPEHNVPKDSNEDHKGSPNKACCPSLD